MITRDFEQDVLSWLDSPQIIAIRGPRQCGKTTFLQRVTDVLLKRGVSKQEIHFVSFEDYFEVEKFTANPRAYISFYKSDSSKKHFFLFDEVQYIKNAGKLLKLIYDEMKDIKIIITGSSTLDLNDVSSFLVGRVLLFELYPFSFLEFLRAKDQKMYGYYAKLRINLKTPSIRKEQLIFLNELNTYLKEYVTYGGYPAVVLENDFERKKVLLKNLFITYVEKDVVKMYGERYRKRVSDLVKHLASINSGIINYQDISTLTALYDKEVKEILSLLVDTYIISLIKPFHKNLATELKKNPKIYFVDTGLRNFITGRFEFSDDEYGNLLENYVLGRLRDNKVNYWRTTAKAEVDFIYAERTPIEVKITPKITRSFRSFLETYQPPIAFLATMNDCDKVKVDATSVHIIPMALL